jgi:hypothetical protein
MLVGTFTIGKAKPALADLVPNPILPTNFTYDANPHGVAVSSVNTLIGFGAIDSVYYVGVSPTSYQSGTAPTNAGTYEVRVNILTGTNYTDSTNMLVGTFTIGKAKPTLADLVANPVLPDTVVYDGNPHGVAVSSLNTLTGFGAIDSVYYVGVSPTSYQSGTAPTNAGSYQVRVNIAAGTNYTDSTNMLVGTFTITKKLPVIADLDITPALPTNFIYNGNPQGIAVTSLNTLTGFGGITTYYTGVSPTVYAKSTTAPTNVGDYQVSIDVSAGVNYTDSTNWIIGTFTIDKAKPAVTDLDVNPVLPEVFTYDGNPHGVVVSPLNTLTGFGTIDSIYYVGIAPTVYQSDIAPTDAGNYEVYVDISAGTNYTDSMEMLVGTFSIDGTIPTIADLDITPALPTSFEYNGNPQGITVTPQSGLVGFGIITTYYTSTDGVTYPKNATPPTDAGEYEVSVEISAGANYDATDFVIGTYTIDPKVLTEADLDYIIPTGDVYNAMPQGIGTVTANSITAPNFDGTIIVKYNGVAEDPTDADTYILTVEIEAGLNYAAVTEIELNDTYTINKKEVYVTIGEYVITEGDTLPAVTIIYTGFLTPDDEDNALDVKAVEKFNVINTNTPDTTDIDFATEAVLNSTNGANYVLVHESGKLIIVKKVGIKDPAHQVNNLKAYVNSGTLYVSGLEAGKIWTVYTTKGNILYQSVATNDSEETYLTARGIYIIQSGKKVVKVVY